MHPKLTKKKQKKKKVYQCLSAGNDWIKKHNKHWCWVLSEIPSKFIRNQPEVQVRNTLSLLDLQGLSLRRCQPLQWRWCLLHCCLVGSCHTAGWCALWRKSRQWALVSHQQRRTSNFFFFKKKGVTGP